MLRSWYLTFRLLGLLLAVAAAIGLGLPAAPQAAAASLTQVTNFGTNPTNLQMYVYVPNSVKANPSILLALHGCQGSGPYLYSSTDFGKLADQYGFIVIYPSTNPGGSCWDVSSDQALKRGGGSDPVGLMSMVTYTEQHYGGNPGAVYVTGESSGGMMTNVMLADYPDVFKAGAAYMGVPDHCFYTGTVRGWNGPCAGGQVSMTPQAWGDLVRNADPGYSGPRPRVQLWHGTADTTLNYNNLAEETKQWTNVLGVSQTPSSSDSPVANWNRSRYDNSSGSTQVETYSIVGAGHQLPVQGTQMAAYAIHFLGLDAGAPTGGGSTGALHAVGAGKCLDDPNSTTTLGTQQQIYSCNGQANQTWTHTAANELTLTVGGSTLCLDANGKGTANGTKAIVWSCSGQTNQQWNVNSNGTVTGVQSGLCLDVSGASTANGALAQLWSCNGGSNQQWTLG
ncbi:extracellular catalytic domain type 1 short-chain-length polyhydroxyalkanoate depolymerase [Actinacidiphila bryophytorum]|uniref:extracellular catalytic domain type 1 short-chain-length polyhydroxyalkanoate depolymerase n=1 Tax=Actinacidiphila bryophytorum TaxID=1436133 RepID=UPI002176E3C5|nr:PHB depolymerase family esterase [Actinacidiphila bryophytorum]UWE10545.1 PHB depolymerase family esterase [Actinacidiphila bryophytorum]